MKKNGKPAKTERNMQIIADYKAGMSSAKLAEKWNLTPGYAQKIASEYARKERIKRERIEKCGFGLYVERDWAMLKHMEFILKRVPKSCIHTITHPDNIRTNRVYTKRGSHNEE